MGVIRRKALIEADRALNKEVNRQTDIIMPAVALVMHRDHGWSKKRVKDLMDLTKSVWDECGDDPNLSIMLMVENEIGIEMQNGNGVSFHDLHYMNGVSTLRLEDMTAHQYVLMRIRQKEWVGALVMGAALVALHRKEGYGMERCARVMERVQEICAEYKYDPKKLKLAMMQETLVVFV